MENISISQEQYLELQQEFRKLQLSYLVQQRELNQLQYEAVKTAMVQVQGQLHTLRSQPATPSTPETGVPEGVFETTE